jgi:hypothetical protein
VAPQQRATTGDGGDGNEPRTQDELAADDVLARQLVHRLATLLVTD